MARCIDEEMSIKERHKQHAEGMDKFYLPDFFHTDNSEPLAGSAMWGRSEAAPYILGKPLGDRLSAPADLVVAVDDSGSTDSSGPSRWVQVRELLEWLELWGYRDRVAVLAFSGGDPLVVSPLETPAEALTFLDQRKAVDSGGTAFSPTARVAREILSESPAIGRQRAVVFITDGMSDQGDVTRALQHLAGVPIWVFGLDRDGAWSNSKQFWGNVRSIPVYGDGKSIALAETQFLGNLTGQRLNAPKRRPYELRKL